MQSLAHLGGFCVGSIRTSNVLGNRLFAVPHEQVSQNTRLFGNAYFGNSYNCGERRQSLLTPLQAVLAEQSSAFSTCNCLNADQKFGMPGSDELFREECCPPTKPKRARDDACRPPMPPCLKFVRPPGKARTYSPTKMECGRICMPCCPKARYPPVCFFPSDKPPCCKIPNPRPAFSECDKETCFKPKKICDCCFIRPPPCRLLPDDCA